MLTCENKCEEQILWLWCYVLFKNTFDAVWFEKLANTAPKNRNTLYVCKFKHALI